MVEKIIWTPEAEASNDAVIEYLQRNWTDRVVINYL
jgi:hypothetical protein